MTLLPVKFAVVYFEGDPSPGEFVLVLFVGNIYCWHQQFEKQEQKPGLHGMWDRFRFQIFLEISWISHHFFALFLFSVSFYRVSVHFQFIVKSFRFSCKPHFQIYALSFVNFLRGVLLETYFTPHSCTFLEQKPTRKVLRQLLLDIFKTLLQLVKHCLLLQRIFIQIQKHHTDRKKWFTDFFKPAI